MNGERIGVIVMSIGIALFTVAVGSTPRWTTCCFGCSPHSAITCLRSLPAEGQR